MTNRQTDGRTTTYSEHEHEFTFAKNESTTTFVKVFRHTSGDLISQSNGLC